MRDIPRRIVVGFIQSNYKDRLKFLLFVIGIIIILTYGISGFIDMTTASAEIDQEDVVDVEFIYENDRFILEYSTIDDDIQTDTLEMRLTAETRTGIESQISREIEAGDFGTVDESEFGVPGITDVYIEIVSIEEGNAVGLGRDEYVIQTFSRDIVELNSELIVTLSNASISGAGVQENGIFSTEPTQFNANSAVISENEIATYSWGMGDGTSKSGQEVEHTYQDTGTYDLQLTVTDEEGNVASDTYEIDVIEPSMNITKRKTEYIQKEPTEITFNATEVATASTDVEQYEWDFGDGNGGTGETTTHKYEDTGVYDGTLTITDQFGNKNTVNFSVLYAQDNRAVITKPDGVIPTGQPIEFSGSDSDAGGFAVDEFAWEFSDGGTREGRNVEYTFDRPGEYDVNLKITDTIGRTSNVTETIQANVPPTAVAVTTDYIVEPGETFAVDGTGSQSGSAFISEYQWDFDIDYENNEQYTEEDVMPTGIQQTFSYEETGQYEIELTVVTDDGLSHTDSVVVTVAEMEDGEDTGGGDDGAQDGGDGTQDGSGDGNTDDGTQEDGENNNEPSVSIEIPEDGGTTSSPFNIQTSVSNFELEPIEQESSENSGHLYAIIDGEPFEENEFIPFEENDNIVRQADGSNVITGVNIDEPGEHTITVQAGNSNQQAYGFSDQITVTVKEDDTQDGGNTDDGTQNSGENTDGN